MKETRNKLKVDFTNWFSAQLEQTSTEIKIAFRETLELFLEDPTHPNLRNHTLREKYTGFRSIDVTQLLPFTSWEHILNYMKRLAGKLS